MASLLLRRFGFSLFSLLVVSLLLFMLTRSIPESPARIVLGDEATAKQIAEFDQAAWSRPAHCRAIRGLAGARGAEGDFGRPFMTGLYMNEQIANTLPVTMELVSSPLPWRLIVSVFLGTPSAFYGRQP